ncbi:MAG TPA: glycosyltransferase 87 family protein [Gaiella sp.]|nr:glycosyltransferase 87 family protein [Gaiella sp.]
MRALRSSAVVEAAPAAAILVLAAALRVVGSGSGLPLPLLNPDETNIVPRAWEIVHGGGLDPGWYDYPSLLFLLLSPSQIGLDAPSYGTARGVAIAIGVLGVAAAWWLGRVAYGRLAALTGALGVAVATTHVAYSRMAVTDVLLTLGMTACLALLVTGRLEWAGVAAGLATSAKYPGVVLVVPLLVAGYGRWRRTAVALGLAAAAFAVTSPFVLIHAGAAWDDVTRVQRLAHDGWLGFEGDPPTPLAFGERLWDTAGPLVLVALAALVFAIRRRRRADLVLLSFAAAYCLSLMPIEAHFDRYVLPLVPVVAVLAGSSAPLAVAAVVVSVVPLWWSIDDAAALTGRDSRLDAAAWIDRTVPATDTIAADPSTLPLAGRRVVRLELPGPHRAFDPRRDLGELRSAGVTWLVVGGSVTDRVLAAAGDYPREARFYRAVASLRPAYTAPSSRRGRPWLRVYRIYP